MKKLPFLICLLVLAFPAIAQVRQPKGKAIHQQTSKGSKRKLVGPTAPVDTPASKPAIVTATPAADTAKKDTTTIQKVADVVHDSLKAQVKAPIVQVPVTLKSLIIPGALFAFGALTTNSAAFPYINREAHDFFWDGKPHGRPYLEDYLLLVPAAAVYGLNIAGVKGQNNLIDRSIIYGMSNAIANGIGFGVKYFSIETRPDSSDRYSFPSGHTAEAFVSAEFLHQEYKGRVHWTVIASGYAVATGVAYLRMYHNKHWLSDVVGAAGVGIASTRFSYYLYPLVKHLIFGSKKVRGSAMLMPSYTPGGGVGLSFVRVF